MTLRSLIVLAAAGLSLSSCAEAKVPIWGGRLFFGDSAKEGLSRNSAVDPDFISCTDKQRFDQMVCMSLPDFKSWNDTYIGGCEKWKGRKGTILVEPRVLVELMIGVRRIQDLRDDEITILAE